MGNLLLDQLCATADYSVEEKGVINFQVGEGRGGMGNDFLTWSTLCHIGFFCRGKGGEKSITDEETYTTCVSKQVLSQQGFQDKVCLRLIG